MKFVTFEFPQTKEDLKRIKRLDQAFKEILSLKIEEDIANMKYLTIQNSRTDQQAGVLT